MLTISKIFTSKYSSTGNVFCLDIQKLKSQATKQGNLPQHHCCRHWGDDLCHGRSPLLTLHICEIFMKKSLLKWQAVLITKYNPQNNHRYRHKLSFFFRKSELIRLHLCLKVFPVVFHKSEMENRMDLNFQNLNTSL